MRLKAIIAAFLIFGTLWTWGKSGWTDEPTKVAVVPFTINAERDLTFLQNGIVDMLSSRLSSVDKVTVLPKETTEQAFSSLAGPLNEKTARELGGSLGADYVLFGSLTIFGESVSIDARMVDVSGSRSPVAVFTQSQGMDSVIPEVDAFAADINHKIFGVSRPVEPEPSRQATTEEPSPDIYAHPEKVFAEGHEDPFIRDSETSALNPDFIVAESHQRSGGFWKSKNFSEYLKGISIGDVDGDAKQETVFISTNTVFIYRRGAHQFTKLAEIAGEASDTFLGVDVADVNGNGKAEIFVTSLNERRGRLTSFVLEWDGQTFVTVSEKEPWYFRVLELPSKGKVLLGQRRGPVDPFSGAVEELIWLNGKYEPISPVEVPRDLNIFAFAMGDVLNNGSEMIVAFNENDRLQILDKTGRREWKSSEPYGGSMEYLVLEPTRKETDEGTEQDVGKARLYLPQRIFIKDLDRDAKQEVLVVKNYSSTGRLFARFRHFGSSEITSLSWDGLGLGLNWKTRKVEGYMSDFAIADFDNDREEELIALVVMSRGAPVVQNAKSAIISYNLAVAESGEGKRAEGPPTVK